jgi:CheY-like chemotaxis protein
MVIDDEIHMRRLIARMLEGAGFQVIETGSGTEALRMLTEDAIKPHVITCDISMPDMTGFEILAAIRNNASLANLPVIMLTAMGQLGEADRAEEMGANGFITKPFSALSLINLIHREIRPMIEGK